MKILIIEDQLEIARELVSMLKKNNYEVVGVVNTGEQAISYIENERPDIVILDTQLQDEVSPVLLTRHINEVFDLPVIQLTVHSDPKSINVAMESKPFGLLMKPVNETQLYVTLEMAYFKFSENLYLF